ncbi:hypothetical protein DL765_002601 [Monosporascus sp. GIB2]|nr:hypothetical protein DL765_002601 [Monosporascus sp. GIB2]
MTLSFAKCFTTFLLATFVAQGAAAFNSAHPIVIRQKAATPTISIVALTETSVSPSMETITASLKADSDFAAAEQFNISVTCNGNTPEPQRARSSKGKKGGHHKTEGGDEEEDEEEDSSCQEPTVSAELSTAVIAGIIVGCILGAAILASIIVFVIVLRHRKRSQSAVKKTQADATVMSTPRLDATTKNNLDGTTIESAKYSVYATQQTPGRLVPRRTESPDRGTLCGEEAMGVDNVPLIMPKDDTGNEQRSASIQMRDITNATLLGGQRRRAPVANHPTPPPCALSGTCRGLDG